MLDFATYFSDILLSYEHSAADSKKIKEMHNMDFWKTFSGDVVITLNCDWFEPFDSSNLDHVEASITKLQFFVGWFANPIYINGKYPDIMRLKVLEQYNSSRCDLICIR